MPVQITEFSREELMAMLNGVTIKVEYKRPGGAIEKHEYKIMAEEAGNDR